MREGKRVKKMRKAIVGALLLSAVMVLGTVPVKAEAATEAQKEKVKQMMIDIFYSADTSGHNVLSYSLKTSEFVIFQLSLKHSRKNYNMNHLNIFVNNFLKLFSYNPSYY